MSEDPPVRKLPKGAAPSSLPTLPPSPEDPPLEDKEDRSFTLPTNRAFTRAESRLTVVETVYHETPESGPRALPGGYSRSLESSEQYYERVTRVGTDWRPLDLGWIDSASVVLVRNEEGKRLFTIPSEEEVAEIASRVVEIAVYVGGEDKTRTQFSAPKVTEPFTEVPPGESVRFIPVESAVYRVRSRNGVARITIVATPR